MSKSYQVVGIGNAIVDVLTQADDSFLDNMGISKGIMQLVERERAEVLYGAMEGRVQAAGGSVANTLAGLGQLGVVTGFIGRVRDDGLGRFYAAAMEAGGTAFLNPPIAGAGLPTSRSMIFVSPDGERSMNTYLGISAEISPKDVPREAVGNAALLFLEGYLFDRDVGKEAFHAAAAACRAGGGRAGIALSDPFCVERHLQDFRALVETEMDFVIGNAEEWSALYGGDPVEAAGRAAGHGCVAVCTRSGEPVIVVAPDGSRSEAPVRRVVPVDATGAGDQFAAGFLFGYGRDLPLEICARMGVAAAAEVIGHVGARPETPLPEVFAAAGLA